MAARRRRACLLSSALIAILALAHGARAAESAPGPADERLARFAARLLGQTDRVRTIHELAAIETPTPAGVRTLTQRRDLRLPDELRRTLIVEGEERSIVISGERGSLESGDRRMPLIGDSLRETLDSIRRDLLVLADGVRSGELEILGSREGQHEGAACSEITVSLRGVVSSLCIDDRGQALRQSFAGTDPLTGRAGRIEVAFSDHREAGGAWYPHRQDVFFEGRSIVVVVVERVSINGDLDPALFHVPEEP